MIDPEVESLISFADAPKYVEKRFGRKINLATLYRWRNKGCSGIRIEVVYVLGKPYTSEQAIDRFNKRVAESIENKSIVPIRAATPKQAAKAHARAKAKLAGANERKC